MNLEFRTLCASEIECRVSTCTEDGASLLLYKDARVDQKLLDEVVGPMNWQRHHSRDNANCIVSIWDDDKKAWIEKEDVGTESNTEAAKGLASDSFKRACFNWGVGRELYTAPFIWVTDVNTYVAGKNKYGKDAYTTRDRFEVSQIGYDSNREINFLVVRNSKTKKVVFSLDNRKTNDKEKPQEKPTAKAEQPQAAQDVGKQKIDAVMVRALTDACIHNGVTTEKLMKLYKVKAITDLTVNQFSNINSNWEKIKAV